MSITAIIRAPGVQGPAGVLWSTVNGGAWLTGTAYLRHAGVTRDGSSYRALVDHTAGAANAPGTGADWDEFWQVLALGSSVADVGAVAAIAAEIGVVAGIADDVTAVAAIAANVTAVAANAANITAVAGNATNINQVADDSAAINTAADNLAAIIAAPGAATAAAASAIAAAGSENAAADSADAAAASAGAAAASETNAGDSEAAAAASAAEAQADATQTAADVLSTASNLASTVAAKDLAVAARTGAETAKTGADATKAAMDVALAAVTDYSDTLGLLAGGAKETLVSASVLANRLYATRHDSDGGAWRRKVRWLTLPANMSIVTLAASVSLYSEDVKATTLMKSWTTSGATTARAMNGRIVYGSASGVYVIDMVTDEVWRFSTAGLAKADQRAQDYNQGTATFTVVDAAKAILSNTVNAIDMAVLPGTPIDPARGLPNPTVAVATAGGVSVIHWDGRVTSSSSTTAVTRVSLVDDGLLTALTSTQLRLARPSVYGLASFAFEDLTVSTIPALLGLPAVLSGDIVASTSGLSRLSRAGFISRSAVAHVTNAYNTGRMLGDIKLALAESTADLTSLVEAAPLNDDFSSYADDAALQAVWLTGSGGVTPTLDAGRMKLTNGTGAGYIYRAFSTIGGQRYAVSAALTGGTASGDIVFASAPASADLLALTGVTAGAGPTTRTGSFVAVGSTTYIRVRTGGTAGQTFFVDDISVSHAPDRSVAANHPHVVGTITRTAVASGAELAAHGGFSAANYLEVPYTSAFSFGTGDFAFCGWLNLAANSAIETLVERDSGTTAQRWTLQVSAAGLPQWIVDDGTTTVTSAGTVAIDDARWHFVVAARRGANQELWIDGALVDSDTAPTLTLNNASAALRIGESVAGGAPLTNGTLALLRIGATAPTPAQIRAIYEDERRLFEASAKCLLPGASVSALAYDASTDLLHVATTAGSARLRGLLVVDKDATVYTGIDARDGILATRDSGSADIVLPSIPLREAAAAGIGHNGGPALYDRRTARAAGVTTNATPTVIARFPMDKGEFGQWVIRTTAREYDGGAELAAYEDVLLARRPGDGNLAVSGSVTQRVVQEVTSSMAVSVAANTTTQCIEVTATGVAAKNIEWTVEGRLA